jgi:hypothetical protein
MKGRWSMAEQAAHSRMISEKFLNDLESGILQPVTELVKNDPELFLAFRGGYINVYYRGHNLFKIETKDYGYLCMFDFDHGRYTASYESKLRELQALGMSLPKKSRDIRPPKYNKNGNAVWSNDISVQIGVEKPSFCWEKAKDILIPLIEDFYDPQKTHDHFKEKFDLHQRTKAKSLLLEKQDQQRLIANNRFSDNGFFVYDMEYKEPDESGKKDAQKKKEDHGRFDMLALQVENGKPVKLWLLELKSTSEACTDSDSGIAKHNTDMGNYLDMKKPGAVQRIDARRDDVPKILHGYKRLFGWPCPDCANIDTIHVDYGFVLTGTAVDFQDADQYPVCILKDENDFQIYEPKKAQP